jgi:arylsulfatase A-like enzyme
VSRVEPRITDLVDLAPTLLDLVGLEADSAMQGESLVAILDQRGRPPYLAFTDSMEPDGGLAVAMAGYRLVLRRGEDRAELYRLADDPLELADLSAAEPEKVAVLRRRLEEWQRGVLGLGAGADGESAGDEMLEQLRNLGYIQ